MQTRNSSRTGHFTVLLNDFISSFFTRQRLDAEAKLKADLERQAKEKETERIRLNKHHQEKVKKLRVVHTIIFSDIFKEQLSAALDKEQQYKRQLDSMKETKITLSNTKNEVEKDVTHITFEYSSSLNFVHGSQNY